MAAAASPALTRSRLARICGRTGLVLAIGLFAAGAQAQQPPKNAQPAVVNPETSTAPPASKASPGANKPSEPTPVLVSPANAKLALQAYAKGRSAEDGHDWRAAYEDLSEAARLNPNNKEYPTRRDIDRGHVVQMYVDRAERDAISDRLPEARAELGAAIALDPTDSTVRERWNELSSVDARVLVRNLDEKRETLQGPIILKTTAGVHDFDYRGNVQGAYEEIARQFGLHVTFDVDLTPVPVRLQAQGVDFYLAMKIMASITNTFWRPLAPDLFFVAPDTREKRNQYEASVSRTVLLPASATPEDMTEVLRVVRDLTGITRTEMDTRSRTITFRGAPDVLALATKLVENMEKPRGQMMLDVEILEVNRTAAMNLGVIPPQTAQAYALNRQEVQQAQSGLSGLVAVIQQVFGSSSSLAGLTDPQIAGLVASGQLGLSTLVPPLIAFGGGSSTLLATLPGATANFSNMLSLVNEARHVRLRAEDGHPATFFVGDRVPISTQQYSNSLTSSENIPNVSLSNFPTSTLTTGIGPTFVTTAILRTSTSTSTGTVSTTPFTDILEVNNTSNTFSVFLGNGDGTFQNRVDYPTGKGPIGIATGDFNNDGNLDVAVANQLDGTVSIFLGDGTGLLTLKGTIPAGHLPTYIISADFNSDGRQDLAVTNYNDNTVSVMLGNGDGTFQAQALYSTGSGPSSIVSADFNGDGHPDFAVTEKNDNTVSIFIGNGDGTFKPRVAYATGAGPVNVQSADINGDTIFDLAVANSTDNTISILIGNGDGTFGPETPYPTNTTPVSIAIADFNEDGRPDLAVAEEGGNTVGLFVGVGGGILSGPLDLSVGTQPVSIATTDFNQDGLPDLVAVNFGSNDATVIINSNTIQAAAISSLPQNTGSIGTPYPNVEYLDLGVKLKATPHLHADNEVTLNLSLEIRALSGSSLNSIPVVSNRTIEQTVRLKENETTILSGFLNTEADRGLNSLPGIGSIPGLNVILGDMTRNDANDQLIIMITPKRLEPVDKKDTELYAGHEPRQGGGRSVGATFDERIPQQFQQPGQQPQPQPQQPLQPRPPQPYQPQQPPQQQQQPEQQPGQPPVQQMPPPQPLSEPPQESQPE